MERVRVEELCIELGIGGVLRRGSGAKAPLVMFELCGAISATTLATPPPPLPPLIKPPNPIIMEIDQREEKKGKAFALSFSLSDYFCVSRVLSNSHYHFHKGMLRLQFFFLFFFFYLTYF